MARVLCIDCRSETVKALTDQEHDVRTASFGLAAREKYTALGEPPDQPYLPHDFDAIVFDIVSPMLVDTRKPDEDDLHSSKLVTDAKRYHCAEPRVGSGGEAQFDPAEIYDACRLGTKAIFFLNAGLAKFSWATTPRVVGFGVRLEQSMSERPQVEGVSPEAMPALQRYILPTIKYKIAETTAPSYDEIAVPEQIPIVKNLRGHVMGAAYPVGRGTVYFLPEASQPAEIVNALLRPSSGGEIKSNQPDEALSLPTPAMTNPAFLVPLRSPYEFHVFVSHASEDKRNLVHPLADKLFTRGIRPWIDDQQIVGGESLRRKIDEGLAKSAHGIVVLTKAFFAKEWTNLEMDAFFTSMVASNKRIIPVLSGIDEADVRRHSPLLTGLRSLSIDKIGKDGVVREIIQSLKTFDRQSQSPV